MRYKEISRTIYLLPNLLTIVNVSFGYFGLLAAFNLNFSKAALFIIIAAVIDGMDGIIARATKTQTDFGTQLDSFADAFSFGLVPSYILYSWGFSLTEPSGVGFILSFTFLLASILRLARYNIIQKKNPRQKFYLGLTVPSAALLLSAAVLYHPLPIRSKTEALLLAFLIIFLSFLMISTLRYRNMLNFNLYQRIDIMTALVIAVIFVSLIVFPRVFILAYSFLNVLSGPTAHIFVLLKRRKQKGKKYHQTSLI